MIDTAPRILPVFDSPSRPKWLVEAAKAAASASFADRSRTEWPDKVGYACERLLELTGRGSDCLPPICDPKALLVAETGSGGHDFGVALAGELLGEMVGRLSFSFGDDEICRDAYPVLWDMALDECGNDPDMPEPPDPILFDHSIHLSEACKDGPPWPSGLHYASHAVMEFAHHASAYSSHGLGLAHAAPVPVLWPPPDAPPSLVSARRALSEALENATVSQDEYTAKLHAFLSARDNPNLPDPTVAEADQVSAALRDWNDSVIPAARGLATATYAHAWEWASSDHDRWDLGVVLYAHTEAFLSVHHLRQATDAYDLTDAACCSYAWWWCHDRELDVASLRETVSTW
ncbi:hypothetical protein [Candidatus Poriferisocius sp.]|uniref:hypothetical protein n=1 Tax=Candidatus Poriferisocius sp. TaxID=3101276 RepID=UPI003B51927C